MIKKMTLKEIRLISLFRKLDERNQWEIIQYCKIKINVAKRQRKSGDCYAISYNVALSRGKRSETP